MVIEREVAGTQVESPAAGTMALLPLLFGKHITGCISAVARLGVPDHMSSAPVSVAELAKKVGAHEPSLYRAMRMLATCGVFEETAPRHFCLTPMSTLLRSDTPGTMRHFAKQMGDRWSIRPFEHMTDILRTGEDGVTKAFGKHVFDYLRDEPEEADTFNHSMTSFSAFVSEAVLQAYDFSEIRLLADVGGGHGALLASILKRYPVMQGVVFDLREVVTSAEGRNHLEGVQDRIEFQSGSFFESVPSGCDAYIMKFILHDWSDEACRTILSLIREQLPPNGRVLICEQVVTDAPSATMAKMLDIEMLTLTVGGKERTTQEFDDLFASAGLRLARVVETGSPICVLEARCAD